jgi:hypothetical protein
MKNKRGGVAQIIFLILMLLAVFGLIFAIGTIYKYRDMLQNPLGYNLEKFNLQSCNCFDMQGSLVFIPSINQNNLTNKFSP